MRLGRTSMLVVCLALTSASFGQRNQLSEGDPAPGLDIEEWIEGEGVSIESGTVYVVHFFETVSEGGHMETDTLKSLVRLRDLYEAHFGQGLVVLAVSTETPERLRVLLRQVRQGLGFTVAADRRDATRRAWFQAAGLKEMPVSFIVGRNGKIMHIGDPLEEQFETILGLVLRNRYDPELLEQAVPVLKAARRARKVKNWRMAMMHYDNVIAVDPKVFADIALERFEMMIVGDDMHDLDAAYAYARDKLIGGMFRNDADALRMFATKVVTDPKIAQGDRDMQLALAAASRAQELTGGDDPESLATLALVRFHLGELDAAIDLQTQAYFIAHPKAKAGYKRVLGSYQEAAQRSTSGSGAD